jgi:hypothetical protein
MEQSFFGKMTMRSASQKCTTLYEKDDKCFNMLVRNLKGRGHFEDLCVDGRMILKLML